MIGKNGGVEAGDDPFRQRSDIFGPLGPCPWYNDGIYLVHIHPTRRPLRWWYVLHGCFCCCGCCCCRAGGSGSNGGALVKRTDDHKNERNDNEEKRGKENSSSPLGV